MSFFEDAFSSAKDFGSTVSRKTGQLVDVTKLKVNAADITSEINKRYKALGKAVYDAQKTGVSIDGIMEKCVADIDALNERLTDIKHRIAELQNKVCCPACGEAMDTRSIYCSRCGARMEEKRRASRPRREEAPAPEVVFADED